MMPNRSAAQLLWLALLPYGVSAAAPQVTSMSLRGLQIGGTTTLVIEGSDLLPEPLILAPFPIAAQQLQPNVQPNRLEIALTLDERPQPGIYLIRLASQQGVSNALAVGVDRLEQRPWEADIHRLPVALHGSLSGTDVLKTQFHGQRGMRLVVEVEAERLGARFKPLLRLKDARGRQMAWSSSVRRPGGDARITFELPADGVYAVELQDVLYRAAAPGHFRMKIGELTYADLVFPLGVQRGTQRPLQFAGTNLDASVHAEFDARELPTIGIFPSISPAARWFTGSSPRVAVSLHPELVESDGDGPGELPVLPIAVSGRLSQAREEDQFLLPVKPGDQLRVEVFAQRFHSPLDGVLTLRKSQGTVLASSDDRPGIADPGLDFTVPDDLQQLVLSLRDVADRGGADYVYRIVISDPRRAEVRVQADTDRINVPAGATQVVRLQVDRANYSGPLQLSFEGLPPGVQAMGLEIPAEATAGLVTLSAAPDSSPQPRLMRIFASLGENGPPVVVQSPDSDAAARYQPWLREEFACSVTEPAMLSVAWTDAADGPLWLGSRLPLRVSLRRGAGATGSARLRLLTTQAMPRKKIKENNQDKEVDDVERALRLDGEPTFAAGVERATVELLVPADLPAREWSYVLVAELLADDNKTVLATAATTGKSARPLAPFTIELAQTGPIEAKAGLGATGKLSGKIIRHPVFTQAVTVTLSGLPKEYPAPEVVVPADRSEFELPVRFPYGSKPAELKEVKLTAVTQANPQQSELAIRGSELPVELIKVVPGEPPPADPKSE